MALKTDIRGMVWQYPEPFVVGREQIRQYAKAVKAQDPASVDPDAAAALGYDGLVAPLTFVSIIAVMTQRHFFQHVDVGFETMQIVQVDQKFQFLKPILEGRFSSTASKTRASDCRTASSTARRSASSGDMPRKSAGSSSQESWPDAQVA